MTKRDPQILEYYAPPKPVFNDLWRLMLIVGSWLAVMWGFLLASLK